MAEGNPPSRWLLILAGVLTQVIGMVCLVLALASLPVVHDLHRGMQSLIASVIAALAAIVCGTLAWRGRLVPLALAAGVNVGFGIVLPRGSSALGSVFRILPAADASFAESIVTAVAIVMFVAAVLCLVAIPSAVKLRRWAREEIARSSIDMPAAPRSAQTLKGFGTMKLVPTQIVHLPGAPPKGRMLLIAGVAVTVVALGVVVITAASTGSRSSATAGSGSSVGSARSAAAGSGSAAPRPSVVAIAAPGDAAATAATTDAAAVSPSIDDFITTFHTALAHAKADELAALVDPKAFAFGVEGHELAEGRDAVVAMLRTDLGAAPAAGFEVMPRFHQAGHDADVAWFAEELRVGPKTYVMTAVAGLRANEWTISAMHWAIAMPNETAYRLAREGSLGVPDAIPDAHDDSPLATAMRTAFASKPSFVEARSTRPEAFNFGSAPGERIIGGDSIKKTFARLHAVVRLHDAVKVGAVGDHGGWGAANVDFTDADRDGTQVTQTFRVLAAWVKEDGGWRIVSTQWSNAR
jgi:hypothetical protein